jgi:hypothetical protein
VGMFSETDKKVSESDGQVLDYRRYNSKVLGLEKEEGIYINKYKQAFEKVYVAAKNPDQIHIRRKEI